MGRFHLKTFLILFVYFMTSLAHSEVISSPRTQTLSVTTFNLKWFGLGGAMWNTPEQEFRQELIKRFLSEELPDTEIYLFTEVVKTDVLSETLKDRFSCVSYEGGWSRHQHIVLCFDKNKYRAEKYDEDHIISEVDLGHGGLRPALQSKICHLSGPCFLQVLGVHLAAGPKSEKRIEQFQHIKTNLAQQDQPLPTIVLGDFNSYSKQQSGLDKDDIEVFESLLSTPERAFVSINKEIKTYSSGEWAKTYDHIVISSDSIKKMAVKGYQSCQNQIDLREKFVPYPNFRKYFSDHCPVTAQLEIKNH